MTWITIDQKKCNQDGLCVSECPTRIIRLDPVENYPVPLPDFSEACLKCGHCVTICPTGALSLDWLSPENCTPITDELQVTPEQAEQFLCARRSIRSFKKQTISDDVIEKLLEIACSAPSAKNQQPWYWTVVRKPDEVKRLAGMVIDWMREVARRDPQMAAARGFTRPIAAWDSGDERICRGAPHIIVAHADKNWVFGPEDSALALGLLDLYATSIGLGACWGGYFYKAVNAHPPLFKALGLPDSHKAFGAIMLGVPKFNYRRIPVRRPPRIEWR
jgi:nitroreductase/NAD-dependent dihydropyrimidine dehydrogenase PreA subunit